VAEKHFAALLLATPHHLRPTIKLSRDVRGTQNTCSNAYWKPILPPQTKPIKLGWEAISVVMFFDSALNPGYV
jgi:hypothetical protein